MLLGRLRVPTTIGAKDWSSHVFFSTNYRALSHFMFAVTFGLLAGGVVFLPVLPVKAVCGVSASGVEGKGLTEGGLFEPPAPAAFVPQLSRDR